MRGMRKKGGAASSAGRISQRREAGRKAEKRVKASQQQKLSFDLVDLDDPVSASQATSFNPTQAWRITNRRSHLEAFPLPATSPRTAEPSGVSGDETPGSGDGSSGKGPGLWVDRFAPRWEDELAVHRKKVHEVSRWFDAHFGPPVTHRPVPQSKCKGGKHKAAGGERKGDSSGKECSSQPASKVLALVGPPGCGKTALVHVVAAARDVRVMDWQAPVPLLWDDRRHIRSSEAAAGIEHQEKLANFSDFLRSSRLFSPLALSTTPTLPPAPTPTAGPLQESHPSSHSPASTPSPSTLPILSSQPPLSRPPSHAKRSQPSLPVSAPERGQMKRRAKEVMQRPKDMKGERGEMMRGRDKGRAGGKRGIGKDDEDRNDDNDEDDDEEWLPTFSEAGDDADANNDDGGDGAVVRHGRKGVGATQGRVSSGGHAGAWHVSSSSVLPPSPPPPLAAPPPAPPSLAAPPPAPPPSSASPSSASPPRHVLLIDDLPYVSGRQRCEALCHAMQLLAAASHVPAVVVLSLPTTSSSAAAATLAQAGGRGGGRGGTGGDWRQGDGVPTRDVLDALMSGGAHKVEFNPIAPGAMHKALAGVAAAAGSTVAAAAVAGVAESSGGDLRHAISQLQLLSLSTRHPPAHTWDPGGGAAGGGGSARKGRGGGRGGSGAGKEGTEQEEEGVKGKKRRKVQQMAASGGGSAELVDLTRSESDGGGEEGGGEKGRALRRESASAATATGGAGGGSGGAEDAVQGAGRDDPLSIFHAVGKFLHNKRLPAAQHMACEGQQREHEWVANPLRWQQWGQPSAQQMSTGDGPPHHHNLEAAANSGGNCGSDGSGVAVRQELQREAVDMEAAEMVLQRAQIPPMKLCCYLHENMLDMFHPCDGLEAAVGASAALSDALAMLSSSASSHLSAWAGSSMAAHGTGGGDEDLSPAAVRAAAAASVAARGVMFWNTQPAPKRFFAFRSPVVWASDAQMRRNKASLLELRSQCFTIAASQSLPLGSLRGSGADIATDISMVRLCSLHTMLRGSIGWSKVETQAAIYDHAHDSNDDIEDL
ncbi:hypothetical protein CLOM_g19887 [Closterium sp. NIES-68]|nr:hypothetical protein CLOM_g19887 [Closterium sp. NIES-68]GJP79380.1 hypothetical protein CLOP_g9617 [Closterium sp. NIES-67]